jgi:hypothetical protein
LEVTDMEILVLGLLALAMVFTFFLIAIKLLLLGGKLLFALLALPFKLVGALAGCAIELAVLPLKLLMVFFLLGAVVIGLVLLPILLPVIVVAAVISALVH